MIVVMGRILIGDCRDVLRSLPEGSVDCCVTSPPYWGLRDYGVDGQLGNERTYLEYVAHMVEVFREVRRVLRDDGTLWLNLGDCYATDTKWGGSSGEKNGDQGGGARRERKLTTGLKPKDLVGIPWRVAFALQDDGWYLRSDIIWHKPNPMPESVRDRPTKAHEYLFLLSKSERYYYDAEAAAEKSTNRAPGNVEPHKYAKQYESGHGEHRTAAGLERIREAKETRNRRTVWTVGSQPYSGAHFATFPPKLIEPCILAGCPAGGTVLDCFGGSGTTGLVAEAHGRDWLLCELNPKYAELAERRVRNLPPPADGPEEDPRQASLFGAA